MSFLLGVRYREVYTYVNISLSFENMYFVGGWYDARSLAAPARKTSSLFKFQLYLPNLLQMSFIYFFIPTI